RTQRADGTWSGWQLAGPESDDLPDRGTAEWRRSRGWHLGSPFWVGRSERIQYRLGSGVRRLRAFFVRTPLLGGTPQHVKPFATNAPTIITRAQWGANEAIRRNRKKGPKIADNVHIAIVHHTAGTNNYTRAQSAAIVRGIETYHVLGNGWDDIGYNFLVDKYGQIFEGRYGGMEKAVVGAHALGFNYGAVGVALIGNYDSATITPAERASLVNLLAWRLDLAHLDPLSMVSRISAGNPNYPKGTAVTLRAISGHRDTYPTSCPGNNVYAQLPSIARQVTATGLPKIYSPIVIGGLGGNVRFTARLSSDVPWKVTVTNSLGKVVGSGTGTTHLVDWTWDASLTPSGTYRYAITAGGSGTAAARRATGTIGESLPPLAITQLLVTPTVVSPNGDGVGDTAQINYFLSVSAPITMTLSNAAGQQLVTLFSGIVGQGAQSFAWKQIGVGDGRYIITITAGSATGRRVTAKTTFYVDRTLAQPKLSFSALSPNGDGLFDATALTFRLDAPAAVRLELWRGKTLVGTLLNQAFGVGPAQVSWDGKLGAKRVADGSYQLVLKAKDALTTVTQAFPIVVDTKPPRLKLVSRSRLRFWTNEPASLTVTFGSRRTAKRVRAGYFTLPVLRGARHFTVVATDSVGNKATLRG
ncbi:MAG TPA: peptidoglycan recognition protein, partial [Gaiellaceae bacterium]|nr:peptidoglycan recognition protein [Gaiellaceae bacterium]